MKQLKLNVKKRKCSGTAASNRLRKERKIPAVIYGKSGSHSLVVEEPDFIKLMRSAAGVAAIVEVTDEEGVSKLSVIQEASRDALTDKFLHVDFHEVSADEKMHASLPIHTVGECVGVKNENGILEMPMHSIDIACLPKDLPEYIQVDVSELHAGQSIHVRDLPELPGVTFGVDGDVTVVLCATPKKVEEEAQGEKEGKAEGAKEEEKVESKE